MNNSEAFEKWFRWTWDNIVNPCATRDGRTNSEHLKSNVLSYIKRSFNAGWEAKELSMGNKSIYYGDLANVIFDGLITVEHSDHSGIAETTKGEHKMAKAAKKAKAKKAKK